MPMLNDINMTKMLQDRIHSLEEENHRMKDTLEFLESAIKPSKRIYDQYGYCNVHKGILIDFERRVKQALYG